jgi:hypothetical protein
VDPQALAAPVAPGYCWELETLDELAARLLLPEAAAALRHDLRYARQRALLAEGLAALQEVRAAEAAG